MNGIGQEVDMLSRDAELDGGAELNKKQQLNPMLKYTLALQNAQEMKKAAEAYKTQQQGMAPQTSVTQQLEQQVMPQQSQPPSQGATLQQAAPGIAQQGQKMQQAQMAKALGGGLPSQPMQTMQKMAGGGIVSFKEGGLNPLSFVNWLAKQGIKLAGLSAEKLEQLRGAYLQAGGDLSEKLPAAPSMAEIGRSMPKSDLGASPRLNLPSMPERRLAMEQGASNAGQQGNILSQVLKGASGIAADRYAQNPHPTELADMGGAPGSSGAPQAGTSNRPTRRLHPTELADMGGAPGSSGPLPASGIATSGPGEPDTPMQMINKALSTTGPVGIARDIANFAVPSAREPGVPRTGPEMAMQAINQTSRQMGADIQDLISGGAPAEEIAQEAPPSARYTPTAAPTKPREYAGTADQDQVAAIKALKAGNPSGIAAITDPARAGFEKELNRERSGWEKFGDWAEGVGRSGGTSVGTGLTGGLSGLNMANQAERDRKQEARAGLMALDQQSSEGAADRANRLEVAEVDAGSREIAAQIAADSRVANSGMDGKERGDRLREIAESMEVQDLLAMKEEELAQQYGAGNTNIPNELAKYKYELVLKKFREYYMSDTAQRPAADMSQWGELTTAPTA